MSRCSKIVNVANDFNGIPKGVKKAGSQKVLDSYLIYYYMYI